MLSTRQPVVGNVELLFYGILGFLQLITGLARGAMSASEYCCFPVWNHINISNYKINLAVAKHASPTTFQRKRYLHPLVKQFLKDPKRYSQPECGLDQVVVSSTVMVYSPYIISYEDKVG